MAEVKRASFATEDMREGGGNLFGSNGPVRATLVSGKFSKEAPDNYNSEGNSIFGWPVFLLDGDGPEEERTIKSESFNLGASSGDNFTISDDGDYLIPVSDDAQIVRTSKFGTFASSLQNEGIPKTIMQSFAWSAIAGLVGDFKRIADKERNLAPRPNEKKSKFPPSTLCLVKLHSLPGDAKKTTPATATKATVSTSAPVASGTGDLDADTLPFLETALKAAGGSLQRGRITLAVSKAAMGDANRQSYARRAAEESYINTLVEAGVVTYAASEKGQPVTLNQ